MIRGTICGLAAALGLVALACSTERVLTPGPGQGVLAVKLTDAHLPLDSIKEVNIFVVRVDARRKEVEHGDSAELNLGVESAASFHRDDDDAFEHDSTEWVTIAEPNRTFNLLELQNGVTAFLGETVVDTGTFKAIRIVIDPAQSSIVLKDGTVITPASDPPVEFESRGRHAIKVEFETEVDVDEGEVSTITIDIRLGQSVTLRGRTIRDGFIFRPFVTGRCEH